MQCPVEQLPRPPYASAPRPLTTLACLLLALSFIGPRTPAQQLAPTPAGLRLTVEDAQQRAVPGATCLLFRGDERAAPAARATTDEQGVATFPATLAPATYTLRVELQGFETLNLSDVVVKADAPHEIVVTLKVAAVAESVTVAAAVDEATGVETGASTPAGNLKRQSLQRLPLAAARVEEALPLIPGVVRSATGEISIEGAGEPQSALLINGLNAADPASGNFRLNLPIDSVESVQVFQHPYTAEYGQFTGGVTAVETRRGSEAWHFEVNDFLPDVRFVGGHPVGIAEDAPRLNFNGPLLKDRLFLSQSLAYSIAKQPVRGLSFPSNETKTEGYSSFTQFDLILNHRHTQGFTFGYFPERDQFVNLDFFRPQPVTPNYRQKDYVLAARDHYELGGGLLQSAFSFKRFDADVWGQGTDEQTLTPTFELGNYFATQARRSRRLELFEVYTFPAERLLRAGHEIKLGFDFNSVRNHLNYAARPVNITRADGTLAERIVFHSVRLIETGNREYVGFAQDRLLARPNLSFDVGLRFENLQIADEHNLAPRAGFAWSPFKGDRTVLRGGIGFFYDKVPLNVRSFARYPSRTVTRFDVDGMTVLDRRHFANVLVDTKPVEPLDFRRGANTDAGFVPENLRWNIQLDQTVTPSLFLRANLTVSRTEHIYIVNPELDFRGRSGIVLRSAGEAAYRALELTARLKLPNKDQFFVSYVRSRARGDLNDFNSYFGDFGAPVIRASQYGNLPFDVPNRLLAWGTFNLPHRVTLAPIFEARTGFPYSVRDAEQNFVGVRNSDATRFPAFVSLDVEVAKEFQVTKKYGVRLSLRGFNLTDHFNPRDVRLNTADPHFGQFFAPYHRFFSGGFDIIF
ncbi:MAG: TonB-dependent receptor [Acidobacteria bacterium]|nr:TonB-dependent receptor [Acidobacteriota bacterium]